jgi:glutathione S-transferase
MEPMWRIVENQLEKNTWLAGDTFTMADIPMGIMAHWWYSFPIDHSTCLRCQFGISVLERPSFQKAVAVPYAHAE